MEEVGEIKVLFGRDDVKKKKLSGGGATTRKRKEETPTMHTSIDHDRTPIKPCLPGSVCYARSTTKIYYSNLDTIPCFICTSKHGQSLGWIELFTIPTNFNHLRKTAHAMDSPN